MDAPSDLKPVSATAPGGYPAPARSLPGILWPGIPDARTNLLMSILFQFEQTQWWPASRIQHHQMRQLHHLIRHSAQTVRHYWYRLRDFAAMEVDDFTLEHWREFPILTRDQVQKAGAALNASSLPDGHGPTSYTQTSGSTGTPIRIRGSKVSGVYFHALNLRHHLWFKRDLSAPAGTVRVDRQDNAPPPDGRRARAWAAPLASGSMYKLSITASATQQLEWLRRHGIAYFLTYPTNVAALLDVCETEGVALPALKQIITFGETLPSDLRSRIREVRGIDLVDTYSSMEADLIAMQCPQREDRYHVQAENILVEVLRDDGSPCDPGEVGRLVLTPLHNFATPLLRYEIGDYAEVGEPCSCGRGLPVLNRIIGRVRNMYVAPNGQRYWPNFLVTQVRAVAPDRIRQVQVVQTHADRMRVVLAAERPLSKEDEESIAAYLRECFHPRLRFEFDYRNHIERSPGGKYEDFRCEVDHV